LRLEYAHGNQVIIEIARHQTTKTDESGEITAVLAHERSDPKPSIANLLYIVTVG